MRRAIITVLTVASAALLVPVACRGGDNKKSESKSATEAPAQAAVTQPPASSSVAAAGTARATRSSAAQATSQPPPTQASGGQSVSASELKTVVENWSKVKSFRARMTIEPSAAGQPKTEAVMELVRPDRLHFSISTQQGTFETITIGNDSYIKIGPNWTKSPGTGGGLDQLLKPSQIDTSVEQLATSGVTKGGTDSVNGKRCQLYTVQLAGSSDEPTEVCVDTDSKLPLRFVSKTDAGRVTIVFTDYNSNIDIKAPI